MYPILSRYIRSWTTMLAAVSTLFSFFTSPAASRPAPHLRVAVRRHHGSAPCTEHTLLVQDFRVYGLEFKVHPAIIVI